MKIIIIHADGNILNLKKQNCERGKEGLLVKKKSKVQVFDTPPVNCFKVESDAALLPS